MISRRLFIGGCFAAFSTNALTAGGLHKEPRSWTWVKYRPTHMQNFTGIMSVMHAARSDGALFFTSGTVDTVEMTREIAPILRKWLDTYLHSDCDCRPGYDCGRHKQARLDSAVAVYEVRNQNFCCKT